jgi:hypothetical protein
VKKSCLSLLHHNKELNFAQVQEDRHFFPLDFFAQVSSLSVSLYSLCLSLSLSLSLFLSVSLSLSSVVSLFSLLGNPHRGAIQCAHHAKSTLKLKFDEIFELCSSSESTSPVTCYENLSQKDRKAYGMQLCANSGTELPSVCWKHIMSIKGTNKINENNALEFCKSLEDTAPLKCLDHILHESSLSLTSLNAMSSCQVAIYPEDSQDDISTSVQCLQDLKKEIQPSRVVTANDVIQFCFSLSIKESNASQICFQNSSIGTLGSSLSPQQRLSLCLNSQSDIQPVKCIEHLFTLKKQNQIGVIDEGSMIELCRQA